MLPSTLSEGGAQTASLLNVRGYDRHPGDWDLVETGPWLGPISRVTPLFERLPLSTAETVTPAWTDLG